MEKDRYYPKLDEKMLKLVATIYENDPNYFLDPKCPYSKETKDIYQKKAKHNDFDGYADKDLKSADNLLEEINLLGSQLKQYWSDIQSGDSTPADKNTYFRLASALLEKMINMKERLLNIKEFESFIVLVLDVIDRELDLEARTRVLERFKLLQTPLTEEPKESIPNLTTTTTTKDSTGEPQSKLL